MTFRATVVSGRGNARALTRSNAAQLRQLTGVDLIEGSLNLVLGVPLQLRPERAALFAPQNRMLWQASLGGVPVWLYRWRHAPLHVLEVLAEVRLRDALSLSDGSRVNLSVSRDLIAPASRVAMVIWAVAWLGREKWYYTGDVYKEHARRLCRRFSATQLGIRDNL